jgi:hypothetical protein
MKKMLLVAGILILAVACETPAPVEQKAPEKVAINPEDYPYTLKEAYKDWQAGKQENAILVLKMIKAWETQNAAECASYFADTVMMSLDYYSSKLSNNNLLELIETGYGNIESIEVEMRDWESVVSADGKHEWVTLWYNQTIVDNEGKSKSLSVVNDAKIENGKIAFFDEYVQHPPMEKE